MISNKEWQWNIFFILFTIKTFCLIHNRKATVRGSRVISPKQLTLQVNGDVICILFRRSFKTCFDNMSLHSTGLPKESCNREKNTLFFESQKTCQKPPSKEKHNNA